MTEVSSSPVRYIDREILEEMCHAVASRLFSEEEPMGLFAEHDPAALDACLAQPRQALFNNDLYPTLFQKAAVLAYLLNRNHPFTNGNKRMSAASLVVFLFLNGRILSATPQELRDKTLEIAKSHESIDDVTKALASWIEERSASIDETIQSK